MKSSRGTLALTAISLGFTCLSTATPVAGQEPTSPWWMNREIVVDREAWGWNWSSWDQEKVATFGRHQYSVYWDADKIMVIVRRDLRDDSLQTLRLPKCTLKNNDAHR
ncbi:MAG: hypothetical protein JXQ73_16105, partial [Phycisphaerae bacterium]|nr:hypothetical protein [Phycisphaerae bacterium]